MHQVFIVVTSINPYNLYRMPEPFTAVSDLKEGVLGLCAGKWVFQHPDGSFHSIEDLSSPSLVTILESSPSAFSQRLQAGLQSQGPSTGLADDFPVSAIIGFGLRWGTDYWESLGLNWAEEQGSVSDLQAELTNVATSGKTQRNRHRAKRILKSLRGA